MAFKKWKRRDVKLPGVGLILALDDGGILRLYLAVVVNECRYKNLKYQGVKCHVNVKDAFFFSTFVFPVVHWIHQ